ncbi:MarR family transcriptional regulator [Arthrobacter agilis]|uniref:MarR family winged helix-turn-helix transcriptional regulator n=1 Tax=Arthrobacter agilis TaxID=37921 RepID=UPI002366AB15|nr:MarR family transcriptional regulator [Arthrobacter agilis]WDF32774.1 MarR family transcriptional regulator [Arthrobacter agilis]
MGGDGGWGGSSPRDTVLGALEESAAAMCRNEQRVCWTLARGVSAAMEPGAYSVLAAARRLGPCRVTDLAVTLGMSASAISGHVAALAGLGFVGRVDAVEDERSRRVTLTDDGRRRVDGAQTGRRTYFRAQLRGWTTVEIVELADLLARFNEAYLMAEFPEMPGSPAVGE